MKISREMMFFARAHIVQFLIFFITATESEMKIL